jgi:hypothetical protein
LCKPSSFKTDIFELTDKLTKSRVKVMHGRSDAVQMAEVAIPPRLFQISRDRGQKELISERCQRQQA